MGTAVKIRWRFMVLASLSLAALLFFSMQVVFSGRGQLDRTSQARTDVLFRPIDSGHIGMARSLVDKSSWTSNYSSPEYYQFKEEPKPYQKSSELLKRPAFTVIGSSYRGLNPRSRQVNNVPEAIRRLFIFQSQPVLKVDLSKDYINTVFHQVKRDKALWSVKLNSMSMDEMIYHINDYRHKARRKGKKMDIFDDSAVRDRGASLKHWEKWYLNISQYEVYRHDDPLVDMILHDLANEPIVFSKQMSGGTQLKLKLSFADELEGLWKPMRFPRDQETLLNHYYFSDFERHHAEIAAFHLDRVFGFRRNPPVSGRILNITTDIERHASERFLKTMFYSPVGNRCFYGKCSYYCDSNHAICGHPDWLEGSVAAFLPPDDIAPRDHRKNPWKRSYSRRGEADWESDEDYCDEVRETAPFDEGRVLIDLIDLHIFDFIQTNMDRHHYEVFEFPDDWKNDTTPVILDNGRGWGKMYRDEFTILAPLYQCCIVRYSTLQKLLLYDEGPYKLSQLLDHSTKRDPLYPILAPGHLSAVDRRVKIILKEVQNCITNKGWSGTVIDDTF